MVGKVSGLISTEPPTTTTCITRMNGGSSATTLRENTGIGIGQVSDSHLPIAFWIENGNTDADIVDSQWSGDGHATSRPLPGESRNPPVRRLGR